MNKNSENLKQQICKEITCKKKFNNNGRNAHVKKDCCSSSCSAKYHNRIYRNYKAFLKYADPDVLSAFLTRTYTKKESRSIIEFVLKRSRISVMDKTFLLIELLEKNKSGVFS